MVGIDQSTGTARFTFGIPALFDGISVVVITVALLAIGEVLHVASKVGRPDDKTLIKTEGRPWLSKAEFRAALPAWLRGTAFGVPFGIIPAGGAEVPTFLAYGTERKLDARRKVPMFGKGSIQGVAGPEAAGNATGARRWARCWRSACRRRPPRPCCLSPSVSTACSPGRCCSSAAPTSSGRCWRRCSSPW